MRWAAAASLVLLFAGSAVDARGIEGHLYVSPVPGSRMVSPWNNIVIRGSEAVDPGSLGDVDPIVTGSRSGRHAGHLALSDDGASLVFTPRAPFALGEHVTVRMDRGARALSGRALAPLAFEFTVAAADPKRQPRRTLEDDPCFPHGLAAMSPEAAATPRTSAQACDTLPTGYPPIFLVTRDDPDPGHVFLAPFSFGSGSLVIMDNNAMPIFARSSSQPAFDFKRQPDGRLTYAHNLTPFYALDSTYALVDSFMTGNGYTTDVHECVVLPNGHALLMAYDMQPVDMSAVVPGGRSDAQVIGLIVQEIDTGKNVVFQWRSWDHFPITDLGPTCMESLTDSIVDYVHGNAIDPDPDGNLLISSRHLNEITKIDRATGSVIWRLGLHASQNQFTFIGDPRGFTGQHDVRRLPNGHVTLFDNGNCQAVGYSRALEYELDETAKTATLVWEHRNTPDTFGAFMGNVQRRESGGTMIGWGGTWPDPKLTDLHADGSKALELGFGVGTLWTYRAYRFPWKTTRFLVDADSLDFGAVHLASPEILPLTIDNPSGADLEITCFTSTDPTVSVVQGVPLTIPAGGSAVLDVRFAPLTEGAVDASLYVRSVSGSELVAHVVTVKGAGTSVLPAASPPGVGLLALALTAGAAWAIRRRRAGA